MYKYNNFIKTQIYCINFYYDYKNKNKLSEPVMKNIFLLPKNLEYTFAHKYLFSIYII